MATMTCECGQTILAEDGRMYEAYQKHQQTHQPLTQAHWSEAYQTIQKDKERQKLKNKET